MFGPRITTVFRSRWNALFWSLGVLLTAYCSVPSADQGDPQDQKAAGDAVRKLLGGKDGGLHDAAAHGNPWAKTPAGGAQRVGTGVAPE